MGCFCCVTHLIVQTGLLLKEAHVVPIEEVTSATDEAIHLSLYPCRKNGRLGDGRFQYLNFRKVWANSTLVTFDTHTPYHQRESLIEPQKQTVLFFNFPGPLDPLGPLPTRHLTRDRRQG